MAYHVRVLNAECPVCEHYGPHYPNGSGGFTCNVCNTTFGTGQLSDESVMFVDDGTDGGQRDG